MSIAPRLVDMHCHLDRMTNGDEVARKAEAAGIAFFCTTVTPQDAEAAQRRFAAQPNIRVGIGLHPWWIADGTCSLADASQAAERAAMSPYIGEIGLDAGKRGAQSLDAQRTALDAILRAIAEHPLPGRVLSIHAVRAAGTVLDMLERYNLTEAATCIFHWFSGTSDELARARHMQCFFSINEHMLNTNRGREYARIIPAERLLLETDAPPKLDAPYELGSLEQSLETTLAQLAHVRHCDPDSLGEQIVARSARLLGW